MGRKRFSPEEIILKPMRTAEILYRVVFITIVHLMFVGCAANQYVAKMNLIRPYSYELQQKEPLDAPYVGVFQDGRKALYYIATQHSVSLESPTFKTVHGIMEQFTPEVVLVENRVAKETSRSYMEYVYRCAETRFSRCGEPAYTVLLAYQKGIPFIGGEPSDQTILKELSKLGYSSKDLIHFYVVRQIPQWRREKKLNRKTFKSQVEEFVIEGFKALEIDPNWNYDDFLSWYRAKSRPRKNLFQITEQDVTPLENPDATYFQKLCHEVGMIRERNVVQTIERLVNKYERILVVYGAGHLVQSRKVLENMFPTVSHFKPY